MEAFIEGVRIHPCLWNPLHPDYREMHVKDEAWQHVVDSFNNSSIPNIQVAKLEWKKLRDNHRDALKRAKLGKNKLLPAQITTWKYAKAMQFLEPHMKYRITENIEMEPSLISSSLKNSDQEATVSDGADQDVSPDVYINKRRCYDNSNNTPSPIVRQDSDALESFFNCILKSTREMPHWMQTQVKKKIFAVIIEAEECLSVQEQSASTRPYLNGNNAMCEIKVKSEVMDENCDNYS